jgi:signal peptidase I
MRAALLGGLALPIVLAGGVALGLWLTHSAKTSNSQTETFYVPSLSMYPAVKAGDTIIVQRDAYVSAEPAIGDVIVFRAPPAERSDCGSPTADDLVKRIMGTPGQTIWSVGNTIYINGQVLDQTWMHVNPIGEAIRRQTIPPNDYFVMGDNHPESCDSRVWGDVPKTNIIGKATQWISTSGSGSL